MSLRNINEEVGVIKAHLEQDKPDAEFIVLHAQTLLLMARQLASDGRRDEQRHEPDGSALWGGSGF
jgi:hypothetical protein